MSYSQIKLAKAMRQLEHIKAIHGCKGNWDYDPYMQGMFNGIELCLSVLSGREPIFRDAPIGWVKDKPAAQRVAEAMLENKKSATSDKKE